MAPRGSTNVARFGKYPIYGGHQGRDRLRVLSSVMAPATGRLFDALDIDAGARCLDVGCGGGDVCFELARRVGPRGFVLGIDTDEVKLHLARGEAAAQGLSQVGFRAADITMPLDGPSFDVVYARFLLSHLSEPELALDRMLAALVPGGVLVLEDVDFSGYFCHPTCPAFWQYTQLYVSLAQRRGGDPYIGPRLPTMLRTAGARDVGLEVVQPAGLDGDVKRVTQLTMEGIADALLEEKLATNTEVTATVGELNAYARDPDTLMSLPRVIQAWGRRPS